MRRILGMSRILGMISLAAALALAVPATAGPSEGRWSAGLEYGRWKLVEGYWDHSNMDSFAGLSLRRGLSPTWTLNVGLRFGTVRPGVADPTQDAGFTSNSFFGLATQIYNPTIDLQYSFQPYSRFNPYVGFGLGVTSWRVIKISQDGTFFPSGVTVQGFTTGGDEYQELAANSFTFATELGAEYWASDKVSLRLGVRYHIFASNDLDNIGLSSWDATRNSGYADANKSLLQGFFGISYWFGSSDTDHDGIKNDKDLCPRDAEDFDGFQDDDGCPDNDNDGDGILDLNDACPLDPEDFDGYRDGDGCPDPDNDNDGIIDANDACPDEAEDIDGFQDSDGCPDLDNDGDGVPDTVDKCPDTPAGVAVDEDGCREETPAAPAPHTRPATPPQPTGPVARSAPAGELPTRDQPLILTGVTFRTGSAELTPESITSLAKVASSLKSHPDIWLEVRGYTDSTGSPGINRAISQQRATAVRDVLIQMGVPAPRITAVGYGSDYPIADNSTRDGRAQNRRVELHRLK